MKKTLPTFAVVLAMAFALPALAAQKKGAPETSVEKSTDSSDAAAEDWKGPSDNNTFDVTAVTGMGIVESQPAYTFLPQIALTVIKKGFVPDVTDSVSAEIGAGPSFSTVFALSYVFRLRWDFKLNASWTFFALGGLDGDYAFTPKKFELFPDFGVGAMLKLLPILRLRIELEHDFILAGVNFPF